MPSEALCRKQQITPRVISATCTSKPPKRRIIRQVEEDTDSKEEHLRRNKKVCQDAEEEGEDDSLGDESDNDEYSDGEEEVGEEEYELHDVEEDNLIQKLWALTSVLSVRERSLRSASLIFVG